MKKIKFWMLCLFLTIACNFVKSQTITLVPGAQYNYPGATFLTTKNVGGTVLSDIIVGTNAKVTILMTDTTALGVNTWTNVANHYPSNYIIGISVVTGTNNNIFVANRGIKNKVNSITTVTLQNNGSGVFTITPNTTYTAGFNQPRSFSYQDQTNDGAFDILTGSSVNNNVTLATGTLAPASILLGPVSQNGVTGVASGTIGNTSTLTAIVASQNSGLSVLTQTPAGSYTTAPVYYGLGEAYSSIAIGDLTGDGVNDIVTTDFRNNLIVIWKGANNGTFTKLQSVACGINPQGVAIGRLDGNTRNDIMVIEFGTGKIVTFRQ